MSEREDPRSNAESAEINYETILSSISDGISVQDKNFRIVYQNKAHIEVHGHHLGEHCFNAYANAGEVCQGCPVAMAFRDGKVHISVRVRNTETGDHNMEITASPLTGRRGEVVAVAEIVRDITDKVNAERKLESYRKRLEELVEEKNLDLREEEERLRQADKMLEEKTAEQNAILENALVGIAFLKDRRFVWINSMMEQMSGYQRNEVSGRSTEIFYPSRESYEQLGNEAYPLLAKGETYSSEQQLKRKDGSLFWSYVSGKAVDPAALDKGVIWIAQDVTERKHAEEALKMFADVVQHTRTGIVIGLMKDTLGLVNPAYAEMHGYTADELGGRPIADLYAPQARAELPRLLDTVNKKGYHKWETLRLRKDGSVFPAEVEVFAVRDNKGKILYRVANIQDITRRKKEEERLRMEMEHGRLLLELYEKSSSLTDGELYEYILDRAVRITESAVGFFHLVSDDQKTIILSTWTAETLRNCQGSYSRHYPLAEAGKWADCVRSGRPAVCNDYQTSHGRKGLPDGHVPIRRFLSIPVSENDKVRFVLGVGNKVTDYEEHDIAQLEVVANELHKIIMKRRADEALRKEQLKSEKLQAIGTLAGGIAHDFNNLMQGVFGYISLAKGHLDRKEDALAGLEQAEKALGMSINLSNQLLTFSKGGSPVKSSISLLTAVRNSAGFALSGSPSSCRIKADEDLWDADADPGQAGQVIQNIVLNANEAMPGGGIVDITIDNVNVTPGSKPSLPEGGRFVRIVIRDSGVGIAARCLPMIFDPYFTTKQKGSGLGLATSYSIVRNHGGAIEVESEEGKGSAFSIYLPAAGSGEEEPSKPPAAEAGERGRILVMDDDEMVRDVAVQMITGLGHEAEAAENGEKAIGRFKSAMDAGSPFDVVILDLTVKGGMGGEQTIRELQKIAPAVKAIVSSGYSDSPLVSNYKALGFKAVLNKPYMLGSLKENLDKLLSQS